MLAICVLSLAAAMPACADDEPTAWTVAQAESIGSVRGLRVSRQRCQGLGSAYGRGASRRFRRFDCVAGARNPTDRVDTVAVHYRLRVTGAYDGPEAQHELVRASFYGGPGIP
jgi:hypothetical protein